MRFPAFAAPACCAAIRATRSNSSPSPISDSLDAIRAFAGDDLEKAHISPEARDLLSRWDERVAHYELAFDDEN
jgi:hypothetical protein